MKKLNLSLKLNFSESRIKKMRDFFEKYSLYFLIAFLSILSVVHFVNYLNNGLGLAYNDARSHLDIGRRVVEGLKTGLAQLGSVWLPLPHLLMVPTIWSDFMWHTGLAGAIQSMISYVATGVVIYLFLREFGVGLWGRFLGVFIFAANLNILYLQSVAMTELLLIVTTMLGVYEFMKWYKTEDILRLVKSAFYIMLASLIRYDGWFLLLYCMGLVVIKGILNKSYKKTEGLILLFVTLGAFGIVLWFLWNLLIFKDPLYFATGPFSAKVQQDQLAHAGVLQTKENLGLSLKIYSYAVSYNSVAFIALLGIAGCALVLFDKKLTLAHKISSTALLSPLFFNVLALYLGHSVLFIQGLSGNSWFNVRYGTVLIPAIAIYTAYLFDRLKGLKMAIMGLVVFSMFVAVVNFDAVTVDDARVGSSQKNVSEVSGWLKANAKDKKGFVLISAASHDAIIFSSQLPMKKFIHEGTDAYWESAMITPDHWARWIIMRTNDNNDLAWKSVSKTAGFANFNLVASYPFADIYEVKPEIVDQLNTEQVLKQSKQ